MDAMNFVPFCKLHDGTGREPGYMRTLKSVFRFQIGVWLAAFGLLGSARAQPYVSAVNVSPQLVPQVATSNQVSGTSDARIAPYLERALATQSMLASDVIPPDGLIPAGFSPWWEARALQPMLGSSVAVGVDELVRSALIHSPHIRAVTVEPRIRDTYVVEEAAAFDWRRFLETGYDDSNTPVGSQLTTGNDDDRFKDKNWHANAGIRRTNALGGQTELAQRLGAQRNNSSFLDPNPQGTSRLELNYTHPLLNGAGRFYNQSQTVLARIDSGRSRDEVVRLLQDHLLQVTDAYWDLYRARTRYVQRLELYRTADRTLQKLVAREEVDVLYRQILRARAAVAKRQSEIVRAMAQIENAEAELRALVNDPILIQSAELTPLLTPLSERVELSMRESLTAALRHRSDISQAVRTLDAVAVRLGVARNELLPKLDLLFSTYVAGLEGDSRVLSAWSNQFADGRPSFSVGLLWELPQGNRAAKAREQRQRWELAQASSQFEQTVSNSLTEVEIAVREVATTFQEMVGKYHAMLAAADETSFLSDRYELLPGANDSAPLLLEDLFDAQERQADEEAAFVDAQVNYSTSLIRLRKAMGTLLMSDAISRQVRVVNATPWNHQWESVDLPTVPVDPMPTPTGSGDENRIGNPSRSGNSASSGGLPVVDPTLLTW